MITSFTMLLDAPGPLILTSAVIGFIGTVIFPVALYLLNHRMLAPKSAVLGAPTKDISVSPCRFFSGLPGTGHCLSLGDIISKLNQYLLVQFPIQSTGTSIQTILGDL